MKTQYSIQGMHCRSCEILIEDEVKKIPGVTDVLVNHRQGIAEVVSGHAIDESLIGKAVGAAGYALGKEKKPAFLSSNPRDYQDLGLAVFIAVALLIIAKALGLFHMSGATGGSYANLFVVLGIGLTAGVSTCMALVGGLVLGASARYAAKHPRASRLEKFTPHLWFNLGRIASYFVLGGLIGFAGSFFQLSSSVLGLMTIAAGLAMLVLGGQLIDIFPVLKTVSFTLPKSLSRFLGIKSTEDSVYSHKNSAILGGLTFFLPCGFTQAMQLYAISTGSALAGALTMGVFAIGTAPGLLGVGGLSSAVKGAAANIFFKTAGVIVLMLSLFNMQNGLNLMGWRGFSTVRAGTPADARGNTDPNVTMEAGVQVVRMTQDTYGYKPNRFTIRKGVPVRWIINSTDTYTCAASILAQKVGIRAGLKEGENVFEFTPEQTGSIPFSCSMGMMTGSFTVTESGQGSGTSEADTTSNRAGRGEQAANGNAPAAGSCGGGGCGCGGGSKPVAEAQGTVVEVPGTDVQLLKASYTRQTDLTPNTFTVDKNRAVRLEIDVQEDGWGCMGSITIPKLTRNVELFTKGQTITFDFTPEQSGTYPITCAMGMPRGQITVL